jgi:hypothetical protein
VVFAGLLGIRCYHFVTNSGEEAFMKKKSLFLLLVLAALLASFVSSQTALAAERIVELRTPGCI